MGVSNAAVFHSLMVPKKEISPAITIPAVSMDMNILGYKVPISYVETSIKCDKYFCFRLESSPCRHCLESMMLQVCTGIDL